MARAAFVWTSDGALRASPIPEGGARIGRGAEVEIRVDAQTVSRVQASVGLEGDHFVIENVSTTNPTKLNGVVIERRVPLSDGDEVQAGSLALIFHDLAAADRLSGPMCSHCSRENLGTDADCWYCGTSLVNAPTTILQRREVACRLVSATGEHHDLLTEESLTFDNDGAPMVVRAGTDLPAGQPAIQVRDMEPRLVEAGDTLRVNGEPASADQRLATGDRVDMGKASLLVIARVDPSA